MNEIENIEVFGKKQLRLTHRKKEYKEINTFKLPNYTIKKVLEQIELSDLKKIARSLGCKIGKNKSEIVYNIWRTKAIDTLTLIVKKDDAGRDAFREAK